MEDISYFFNTLEISDISLLGYFFKNERIKDEIISKIPHVEIEEIDSSFSFKTYLRDEKLKYLFDGPGKSDSKVPKWFVLDINNICPGRSQDLDFGMKPKLIRSILEGIRSDMYSEIYPQKPFYRLLITCPLQRTSSDFDIHSFSSGSTPLYISDFVCAIADNSNCLQVMKNRHDNDKKISLGGLKDYTYICNYENCQ
jgi:hypothetical protein